MGHRIELGEIETALNAVPLIKQVCCLYDSKRGKITAFYAGDISKEEIISHIKHSLPKYMIPNVYHQLDTLPLNMNGKIDRVKLTEDYLK